MSEVPTPALLVNGGIAPGPHRIHPAYVVLSALRVLFTLAILFVLSFTSAIGAFLNGRVDGIGWLIGAAAVFIFIPIVLTVVISYVYYIRFLWEITESDVHIYSGIIFKKQVHIPFQRVQSIDFNAGIIERVLGLVKLKIETAGGAANKGVLIPALKLGEAEALRAEVFARKRVISQAQGRGVVAQVGVAQGVAMSAGVMSAGVMPGAAVQGEAIPRFDPQTGKPLAMPVPMPGAVPGAMPGAADNFVREIGDESAKLRGIFADDYQENAPIEYEYGLTARELILTALSNDQLLVLFAVLVGVISQIMGLLGSFVDWIDVDAIVDAAVNQMFNKAVLPTIIGVAAFIFVLVLIMGVVGTAISYGGFKARRRGGRIEVERGLLSRQYRGVAAARVQSVEIQQGFIRRLMGYAELKLLTIDSVDASNNQGNAQAMQAGGLVIHPFVKLKRVDNILEGLIPEFDRRPAQAEFKRLPGVSLRRAIIRQALLPSLIYAVLAAAITLVLQFAEVSEVVLGPLLIALWSLVAVLVALHLIGSILWYRHAAYGYNPAMLTIRKGSYGMVTTVIPRKKIQWAAVRQNPFQRLSRVASISATTAAGVGGTATDLRDVAVDEADLFMDWIRPRKKR
jgi:putative membrane protein